MSTTTTPTTHLWRPSCARRLVLDGFVPVPRGTLPSALPSLAWPAKDPADVLDYEFDISAALAGNAGDAIASVAVTVSPNAAGDLAVSGIAADGAVAVLWLSGGQAGTVYTVQLTIATLSGRTIARTVSSGSARSRAARPCSASWRGSRKRRAISIFSSSL